MVYKHTVCRFLSYSIRLHSKRLNFLAKMMYYFNRIVFAADIPYTAKIDPSVDFMHNGLGVVVHRDATIGADSTLYQNVTIGGNGSKGKNGVPVIGERVIIYSGACVLGPIKVGNNAIIGANSVVLSDVEDNAVYVGAPAKRIR